MKRESSAGSRLRALLSQLAALAVADARRMAGHRAAAVHALRVRMKKLRAVLLLTASDPKDKTLRPLITRMKAIKDGLAGGRDALVTERLAEKLTAGKLSLPPAPRAAEWSAERVLRETKALLAALQALTLKPQSEAATFRRYQAACRRVRKAMKRCRHSHRARDFHRWRIRVKTCYFQSLALHRWNHGFKYLRATSKLAHRLGQEHDLALLRERVPSAGEAGEWLDLIEHKRRRLHRRLLRKGKKIYGKPELPGGRKSAK